MSQLVRELLQTIRNQNDIINTLNAKINSLELMYHQVACDKMSATLEEQERDFRCQLTMIQNDAKNGIDSSKRMYKLFSKQSAILNNQALKITRHSKMLREQIIEVKLNAALLKLQK